MSKQPVLNHIYFFKLYFLCHKFQLMVQSLTFFFFFAIPGSDSLVSVNTKNNCFKLWKELGYYL